MSLTSFSLAEETEQLSGQIDGVNVPASEILLEDYGSLDDDLREALKGGDSTAALTEYINMIVRIAIGLGSIGAVLLLVYGGFKYITGQTFSSKSDGKDYVIRALGSLALLFSSFILFNQLNPELLRVRFDPLSPDIKVDIDLKSLAFGSSSQDAIDFANELDPYRKKIKGDRIDAEERGFPKVAPAGNNPEFCQKKLTILKNQPNTTIDPKGCMSYIKSNDCLKRNSFQGERLAKEACTDYFIYYNQEVPVRYVKQGSSVGPFLNSKKCVEESETDTSGDKRGRCYSGSEGYYYDILVKES